VDLDVIARGGGGPDGGGAVVVIAEADTALQACAAHRASSMTSKDTTSWPYLPRMPIIALWSNERRPWLYPHEPKL
jgi:hypothetical protein